MRQGRTKYIISRINPPTKQNIKKKKKKNQNASSGCSYTAQVFYFQQSQQSGQANNTTHSGK